MAQRHSHHSKHKSKKSLGESPHQKLGSFVIQRKIFPLQPQPFAILSAGPWSPWAIDPEGRGFYYRTRLDATGRFEWEIETQFPTLQNFNYKQPAQPTHYYQPVLPAAPAPALNYTISFPTSPDSRESQPCDSFGFTHSFDGEVTSRVVESRFVVPAVIDVDTRNNIKVMVPDSETGEATTIWDNKHNHFHKSKISPNVKVRDWLHRY